MMTLTGLGEATMRTGTVRNLRDAKHYAVACERETGVVADPAWVLDAGGRVVAYKGVLLGGYVLETEPCTQTLGLLPEAVSRLPDRRVNIGALWLHHGLSDKLLRRVSRQLVRDVRRSGRPNVVVVTPRTALPSLIVEGLPNELYAGASGHPDVPWIQIRSGTPASLRRACMIGMLRRLFGGRGRPAELTGPVAAVAGK
jgi:hypothetical protein